MVLLLVLQGDLHLFNRTDALLTDLHLLNRLFVSTDTGLTDSLLASVVTGSFFDDPFVVNIVGKTKHFYMDIWIYTYIHICQMIRTQPTQSVLKCGFSLLLCNIKSM